MAKAAKPKGATAKAPKTVKAAKPKGGAKPAWRAKIRMYRPGLGDCFLITLNGPGKPYRILIDCGVIQGTVDATGELRKAAANIRDEAKGADGKSFVDLLIATHEHYDHVAGFALAEDIFNQIEFGEVWLGWTEDPDDETAKGLVKDRQDEVSALRMGMARLQLAGAAEAATELGGLLSFFGAGPGVTERGLNVVRALSKGGPPRYVRPTDAPHVTPGGARIFPLGPPLDLKFLKKSNPSAGQSYGVSDVKAFFMDDAGAPTGDSKSPFGPGYAIPLGAALQTAFFRGAYMDPDARSRRIDDPWAGGLTEMALKLDSMTNNTSLVVAIELADGDVLLFPADAQIGSWLTWAGLTWTTPRGEVTGADLLKRTIVYKVGHHGSHNATLKPGGLELMTALQYALLPVNEAMAQKKRWGHMPLPDIVDRITELTKGKVARIDDVARPAAFGGELQDDPLFYELTI